MRAVMKTELVFDGKTKVRGNLDRQFAPVYDPVMPPVSDLHEPFGSFLSIICTRQIYSRFEQKRDEAGVKNSRGNVVSGRQGEMKLLFGWSL